MKIKLNINNNFKLVEEGEQILEITKAEVKPSGKPNYMQITFRGSNGGFINSKYDFNNDKALFGMGILISKALGLESDDEFDTKDTPKLVGKKLLCEVVHTQGSRINEETGEPTIFANVKKVISLVNEETGVVSEESPRNMIASQDEEDDLD